MRCGFRVKTLETSLFFGALCCVSIFAGALPDGVDVPAGETREILRLLLSHLRLRGEICFGLVALWLSLPRVSQRAGDLEIFVIACFLKNEILGKMFAVVTQVQTRQENAALVRSHRTFAAH